MIPLRDNIPSRSTPIVTYAIIALCTVVFFAQIADPDAQRDIVERFGMIPARVVSPEEPVTVTEREIERTPLGARVVEREREASEPPMHPWWTVLTCIFLHGGWLHFLGNMWFLYIFGDNVEDRFGRLGYLGFYLFAGIAASIAHLLTAMDSTIPTIGASGAIAGVMGAYFLLYPHARVLTIIPIFFIIQLIVIPAPVFLGIWFAIQFFQGFFALAGTQSAGVAWWAHIGGFVVGVAIAWQLRALNWLKPGPRQTDFNSRPHPEFFENSR